MISLKDIFNPLKASNRIKELETSNTEWLNKFTMLEDAFNNLKTETESAMVDKESFTKQLEDLKAEYENKLTVMNGDRTDEVNKLTSDYETKLTELKNQHDAEVKVVTDNSLQTDELSNVKAAEIVAQLGIEQGTVKAQNNIVTDPQALVKTYQELLKTNPVAAVEYYKEHRSEIIQSVGFRLKK